MTVSASAVRALPFGRYRAANAIARLARRPFLARLPREAGGSAFVCDLRDSIAREVCFTGRYEPQETELARRLIRPGATVLDVGANWGYFSLLAAHLAGRDGRVIALEPHARLHAMLAANVKRNGLSHVSCLRIAAADGAGTVRFVDPPERASNSGLARVAREDEPADFECESVSLDALAERRALEAVDVVKIDVEGAEMDVLRGMAAGLAGGRYRAILLECHPAALADRGLALRDCLDLLASAGYRGWHIDHSAAMHRRAASAAVAVSDLLSPVTPAPPDSPWPHYLWIAPGQLTPV